MGAPGINNRLAVELERMDKSRNLTIMMAAGRISQKLGSLKGVFLLYFAVEFARHKAVLTGRTKGDDE